MLRVYTSCHQLKKSLKVKRIFLTIVLVTFAINVSICCDCIMTTLDNHLEKVNLILRVKVVQILDTKKERENHLIPDLLNASSIGYRAKLEVVRNLKGNIQKGDLININSTFSNCEFKYKIGQEYILFLRQDNDEIFIEPCSYSEEITDTRKCKRYLKKILKKLKNKN